MLRIGNRIIALASGPCATSVRRAPVGCRSYGLLRGRQVLEQLNGDTPKTFAFWRLNANALNYYRVNIKLRKRRVIDVYRVGSLLRRVILEPRAIDGVPRLKVELRP